jgi:hypothetical protein
MTRALFTFAGMTAGVLLVVTVQHSWRRVIAGLLSRGDA